ncbi:hypothetical protein VE04_00579 [Pseudogymnoascus sp. 24MN13]|nr:hypothetical protein VE04_00579 [Pseudogymnoascus sp. 24MN13]
MPSTDTPIEADRPAGTLPKVRSASELVCGWICSQTVPNLIALSELEIATLGTMKPFTQQTQFAHTPNVTHNARLHLPPPPPLHLQRLPLQHARRPDPRRRPKGSLAAQRGWGDDHLYRKEFADKGLYDARVGYIGGDTTSPSYRSVCSGSTGHAEAVQLTFDPTTLPYTDLLVFFYRMHDPTTRDSQGPDTGSQYRSGIFVHSAEQKEQADQVTEKASNQWWGGKVVTQILAAGERWDAEDYHQRYLDVNKGGYECPSHFLRKFPDLH